MKYWCYASRIVIPLCIIVVLTGCQATDAKLQLESNGAGDEIIVAGNRFHTGTRVILWIEPAGYDGYKNVPPFRVREVPGTAEEQKQLQTKGWDLPALQKVVDQLVIHYDGHGLSKTCFEVLQQRGLSVHFMLDLDGTIYQTIDLQERALHATISNDRSIGIEIANIGAFPVGETKAIDEWYASDDQGRIHIRIPARLGDPKIYTQQFVGRPVRPEIIRGTVQNEELNQYDLTPQQYAALIKLTAALCRIFPQIKCDYPRDASGRLITHKLSDAELAKFQGVLGHYHIQSNKTDPGPALQWDKLIEGVCKLLK